MMAMIMAMNEGRMASSYNIGMRCIYPKGIMGIITNAKCKKCR